MIEWSDLRRAAAAFCTCAVLWAVPASAAEWSVGAGIGAVDWDTVTGVAVEDPDAPGTFVLDAVDDSDRGFKLWVARRMWSTFDVEAAWHEWGELGNSVAGSVETVSASADVSALSLSAIGRWPVTARFDIFFRLAWYRWDSEITGSSALARDDSGTELSWGAGVDALVTRRIAIRAEWEKLEDIDFFQGDVYTLGVAFDF